MNDNGLPPDAADEALENNRRNFLPAKPPTEARRRVDGQVMTWTNTTPAAAAAWVDDVSVVIGLMCFAGEIDGWEADHDHQLNVLNKYFPAEYQRISEVLWDARENVSNLRW